MADLEKERKQKEASWQKLAAEKVALKAANEQIAKFFAQLADAIKKAEEDYMRGAECQTAFANIYMDGFNEAKNLIAQAHPSLDLSQIEPVVEEEAVSQAVSKGKAQGQDGAEKDDAQSQPA